MLQANLKDNSGARKPNVDTSLFFPIGVLKRATFKMQTRSGTVEMFCEFMTNLSLLSGFVTAVSSLPDKTDPS